MKALSAFIAFLVFLLFLPVFKPAYAVTVTISDFPSTITDDAFTLTASISGASAGINYLRVDIYKDGTTNYFGETFNGSDFFGGSTYTQYLPITIQSSTTWTGSIQARTGTPTSTQYDSTGAYKIRIRRYTSGGGNTASEANNSAVAVSINIPTPTQVPTDSPTQAPTNTPIPTVKLTNTPTPKKETPTPTKKNSLSEAPKNESSKSSSSGVLGIQTKTNPINKPKQNVEILSASDNSLFPKILIGIGVVFFLLCVIVFFYPTILDKIKKSNNE